MENDSYECPRCHNIFPSGNKILHDLRCTEKNPMPLDKSRILNADESKNVENENKKEEEAKKVEEVKKEEKKVIKEEIKPPQNQIQRPPSSEFPEVFECNICHQVLLESERKDHMYCHNLETEEKNNANEFRISQEEIERQKAIEKQIERNNRMNQRNNERNNDANNERNNNRNNNRNDFPFFPNLGSNNFDRGNPNSNLGINDFLSNLGNAIARQQMSNLNDLNNMINNNNNNQRRNNNNSNSNVVMEFSTTGPNGERIVQRYQGSNPQNQPQQQMPPMFFNFNNFSNNSSSRRRNISFNDFSSGLFDNFLNEFLQRMGNRDNPTDEEILNELPETQIEDVNKLDPEKKNCIICLEDFKNGDKAIILPCIHIFHNECIKNWLKTQNTCPICKYKLTGENMNQSGQ